MKYFIVADVHGFYDEMMEALTAAGYDKDNSSHCFVSLGDLFDRGRQPQECLDFVMSIPAERRILIYGNHEDLMERAIARHGWLFADRTNGTSETAKILTRNWSDEVAAVYDIRNHRLYNEYIRSCVMYHETPHYIFVHGWIPCEMRFSDEYNYISNWREAPLDKWKAAGWYNGMKAWKDGVRETNKTICCGHWHTSWGNHFLHKQGEEFGPTAVFTPFIDRGIVALDACTIYSRMVNCYVVED